MNRKILILVFTLVALLFFSYKYQEPLKKWQDSLGKPQNFLTKVKFDKINKVEIIKNGEATILNKEEKLSSEGLSEIKWRVANTKDFYADSELVDSLLDKLKEASDLKFEIVSNDKNQKKEFGLDEKGINLRLYENDKMAADFIVGKTSGDFSSTYLSEIDSAVTYAAKVILQSFFIRNEWRSFNIFSFDPAKADKIRFQYPNREFTVENKDGLWAGVLPQKFSVNPDKINKIIDIMCNLSSVYLPEQSFVGTGLEKHLIIAQIIGEGINETIMIGDKNKDGFYYAKRADSDNIYLITKETRNELDKWIWQLK